MFESFTLKMYQLLIHSIFAKYVIYHQIETTVISCIQSNAKFYCATYSVLSSRQKPPSFSILQRKTIDKRPLSKGKIKSQNKSVRLNRRFLPSVPLSSVRIRYKISKKKVPIAQGKGKKKIRLKINLPASSARKLRTTSLQSKLSIINQV